MRHICPSSQRHNGIGTAKAEIIMEMYLDRFIQIAFDRTDQVWDCIGIQAAKCVHNRKGIHVPLVRDPLNQFHRPVDVRPAHVDREKDGIKPLFLRKCRRFHRKLYRFFQIPAVGFFDHMVAGRDFNDDPVYSQVCGPFYIIFNAPAKSENLRTEVPFDDLANGFLVVRGYCRHSCLNPM